MKFKIALLSIASALSIGAQAADWSDNSVGYRYAPSQSEPGVSDKVKKNILTFTHVSGDKMGMNLFTIDLLKSNSVASVRMTSNQLISNITHHKMLAFFELATHRKSLLLVNSLVLQRIFWLLDTLPSR